MKIRSVLTGSCIALMLMSAAGTFAQAPAVEQAAQPELTATRLSAAQIDELTGPIALYPDPLIAQILPAATYPTDIVLAARMLSRGDTRAELDAQAWDPSVKALSHYPSIIKMMDERLNWTQQLGAAFLVQPDDVMDSIQRLRGKARSLGHLSDTPQQQVIVEEPEASTTIIRIVPAQPQVVYVPAYDPAVVYVRPYTVSYVSSPYIWFGAGFGIGTWLNLDCDWYYRRCYYPVGWSWSYCRYPSWRTHFSIGWGSYHRYDCAPHYWSGHSHHHHHGHGHGYYGASLGRTNDAHFRSWSRNDTRPAPHLRTAPAQRVSTWADGRDAYGRANVPNHRRTLPDSNGRAGADNLDRIAPSSRARVDTTSRRVAPDTSRRVLAPNQIEDRLRRSPSSSPRVTDRTVPQTQPSARAPSSDRDSLRRTRELPGATRPSTPGADRRSPTATPSTPDSNRRTAAPGDRTVTQPRTVAPSTGPRTTTPPRSSAPSRDPAPSTGRRGLNRSPSSSPAPRATAPSSGGRNGLQRSSPSPTRSQSPSRSSAPSQRSSAPGNRRSN